MIKQNNAVTPPIMEFHTTGTLKKVGTDFRENSKGTKYTFSEVEVIHPNGNKQTIDATTYENSLAKNLEAFQEGKTVGIVVQLDGDYKGRTKLQLAGAREFDLSSYEFGETAPVVMKPVETT